MIPWCQKEHIVVFFKKPKQLSMQLEHVPEPHSCHFAPSHRPRRTAAPVLLVCLPSNGEGIHEKKKLRWHVTAYVMQPLG